MRPCPRCEAVGRSIDPITVEAQVVDERLGPIIEREGWALCPSPTCEVVYFRGASIVVVGETRGVPFHKTDDPRRLVCFCFGFSVESIVADVRAGGSSSIRASIKAACRAGEDDCARKNPQGRCCLGNVGAVLKRATPGTERGGVLSSAAERAEPCCAAKSVPGPDVEDRPPR